jgi:diacylglycerol kinase
MKPRFLTAMASYAGLALLAAYTLDRTPRIVVWLILAALAVKTWIAAKRREQGG